MATPTVSYTGQYKMTQSGNNWELRLLTGGTLSLSKNTAVDVFLVGGGGGGGSGSEWQNSGGGGGGGYTKTVTKLRLTKGTAYTIAVGKGGASDTAGEMSSAFGYNAAGGEAGTKGTGNRAGGKGGSGGGFGASIDTYANYISSGKGGSDGSDGGKAGSWQTAAAGQGSTTRAFGEPGGELFSGGGGGGSAVSSNWINGYYGTRNSGGNAPGGSGGGASGGGRNSAGQSAAANTGGGGGGGGCNTSAGGTGGSGIVILRNTRFGATSLVSAKNGVFGSPVQISMQRDDASATHTLKAVLLNAAGSEIYTETITRQTTAYPTVNWTPGVALYAPLIKNAAQANFQIKCITYVGGDEQGEEELDTPITVSFRAEDVGPTMAPNTVAVSPYNAGAVSGISCFVQGYSKADGSFNDSLISLKYGATIAKREVICNGVSSAVSPYRTGVLTGDTELIARVTDSRGFTAQQSISVRPEAYAKPRLSGMNIFRCDSSGAANEAGGRISAKAKVTVSSLAGENTFTLTAAVRTMYGSFGAEQTITDNAANVLSGNASPDLTQIVRLTVTDRLGGSAQYEHTLTHRKWAMKFRANGEGVGFGKAPSEDKVLEIAEDWQIKRGQQLLPWGVGNGTITKSKLAADVTAAALGGMTMSLLWTNQNPTSEFAAQTINLPSGSRKLYLIVMRTSTIASSTYSFIALNIKGLRTRLNYVWTSIYNNMYIIAVERTATISSDTAINFSSNAYSYLNSNSSRDDWNIPLYIYGINF